MIRSRGAETEEQEYRSRIKGVGVERKRVEYGVEDQE